MVGIENINSAPSEFPDKDAFEVLGWAVLEESIVFAGDRRRCLGHRRVSMGWAVFGFGRLLARRGQRHGTAVRDGAPRVFIHLWGDERERQERSEVRFGHDMRREADVGDAFPVIRIWRRRSVAVFCCLRKISTRPRARKRAAVPRLAKFDDRARLSFLCLLLPVFFFFLFGDFGYRIAVSMFVTVPVCMAVALAVGNGERSLSLGCGVRISLLLRWPEDTKVNAGFCKAGTNCATRGRLSFALSPRLDTTHLHSSPPATSHPAASPPAQSLAGRWFARRACG